MLKPYQAVLGLAILLALIGDSWGQSHRHSDGQTQTKATGDQHSPTADQRGTENTPPFVKIVGAEPNAESGTNQNATNPQQQPTDWIMVGAVVGIGVLQFVAFVWQAIRLGQTIGVMKDTAERQLRAYVYLEVTGRAYPPPPKILDRCSITL
jgi:hypothetical protein